MRALGNVKPNPPTEAVRQDPLNPDFPGATESKERWGPVCPPQTHPLHETTDSSSQILEKGVRIVMNRGNTGR